MWQWGQMVVGGSAAIESADLEAGVAKCLSYSSKGKSSMNKQQQQQIPI